MKEGDGWTLEKTKVLCVQNLLHHMSSFISSQIPVSVHDVEYICTCTIFWLFCWAAKEKFHK